MPPESLNETFDDFNRRYFRNRLPKIPVRWGIDDETVGFCYLDDENHPDKRARPDSSYIQMNVAYRASSRIWKFYLIHEMVHWKLRDHPSCGLHGKHLHGHAFQREMKRLAIAGAFNSFW